MKKIQEGKAVTIGGITVIPVERIAIEGDDHRLGIAVRVEYAPVGIIVDDGEKRWGIGVDGNPCTPKRLLSGD